MPSALLRPCSETGCPELVESGACALHRGDAERYRGTATSRGYDAHWSKVFRPWFIQHLIAVGIAPVCGAALPGGPGMADSQCRAQGVLNDRQLHLDHDPPLRDAERRDRRAVEDRFRVGLLCRSCHSAKTLREQGRSSCR
jgi:hypothetical protein